jgi:hypothetical protein
MTANFQQDDSAVSAQFQPVFSAVSSRFSAQFQAGFQRRFPVARRPPPAARPLTA